MAASAGDTVVTASPTFHAPLYFSPGEIWIDANTTLTPANTEIEVYNNIVVDQHTAADHFTLQLRAGALTGNNLIDYNLYRKNNGAVRFDDGLSWPSLDFAQWQSQLGFDEHSSEQAPLLDANLHLAPGSPAIDAGRPSDATRDYDALPRNGTPDLGADEALNGPALPVPPPAGTVGTGAPTGGSTTASLPATEPLKVFPNPVRDFATLSNLPPHTSLRLFTANEQPVQTRFAGDRLDLRALPPGLYVLEVRGADGRRYRQLVLHID